MGSPGANFRKADLQIHSPRDAGWDGARPEDALGPNATPQAILAAREDYCEAFIRKCQAEGLRAIAITDHHEGVYAYIAISVLKRLQGAGEDIDLWIFPGMELTCKDACQALLIFDSNTPQGVFEKARSKLGLPSDVKPDASTGIAVELLKNNLIEIQEVLGEDDELRNRFIILPHVKPGGHKTVLRKGFHMRFSDMPYVGGYMDQCYPHQLNAGDQRILNGEIPAWGSEKRGVICTSDARHADFRLIGKHASWIKLAAPTAESLRQAMLAPDSRIRHDEPKLPDVVLKQVVVKGSSYLEDGVYELNRQMNAVIGGRGAGKSTLLEYIRFALGCSALDDLAPEAAQSTTSLRMKELLSTTLDKTSSSITAHLLLNGAPVEITRRISSPKTIEIVSSGQSRTANVDYVSKLVPAQPYRQGELSDLASEKMASKLLQLVTANAQEQLDELEAELKQNGQHLAEALAKGVLFSSAKRKRQQCETETEVLKSQLDSLKAQLGQTGVNEQSAVSLHDAFEGENQNLIELQSLIDEAHQSIASIFRKLEGSLRISTDGRPHVDVVEASDIYKLVTDKMLMAGSDELNINKLQELIEGYFNNIAAEFAVKLPEWQARYQAHVGEYEAQKQELQGQAEILQRIEELNERAKKVATSLERAVTEEQEFRSADEEMVALRETRTKLQMEVFKTIKDQVALISDYSSGLARGEMAQHWDCSEAETAIRGVLDIPLLREKRIEQLLDVLRSSSDPLAKWHELLDEFLLLVRWKESGPADDQTPPATPMLHAALEDGFLEKLRTLISSDRVATALKAIIRPNVNLFQKREGTDIEFRRASQGEQAATLLNILMSQSRGPLLIDQPEDDLDNKIINDIIRTIRSKKDERQLILSTHNANIAVNGDSEFVIEMQLGRRTTKGAIDDLDIREAITETMEGGRQAFELRRKKYNF